MKILEFMKLLCHLKTTVEALNGNSSGVKVLKYVII